MQNSKHKQLKYIYKLPDKHCKRKFIWRFSLCINNKRKQKSSSDLEFLKKFRDKYLFENHRDLYMRIYPEKIKEFELFVPKNK